MSSNILGIESTAHTAGVGIITSEGKILSNQRSMYIPEGPPFPCLEGTCEYQFRYLALLLY